MKAKASQEIQSNIQPVSRIPGMESGQEGFKKNGIIGRHGQGEQEGELKIRVLPDTSYYLSYASQYQGETQKIVDVVVDPTQQRQPQLLPGIDPEGNSTSRYV